MFDLPTETSEQRRNYRQFRHALIKNGFVMMQESVYTRMLITPTMQGTIYKMLRDNKPKEGLIQALTVTEKQFSHMEYIVGNSQSDIIDSDERLVIL